MLSLRSCLAVATFALVSPVAADSTVAAEFADAMVSESGGQMYRNLVKFSPAPAEVSRADRARLQRMAKTWALSGQRTIFEVHGYSTSLDMKLAERRAEIVRRYLTEAGIAPARVVVVGHTLDAGGRRIDVHLGTRTDTQCGASPDTASSAPSLVDEIASGKVQSDVHLASRSTLIAAPVNASATSAKTDAAFAVRRVAAGTPPVELGAKLTIETVVDRIRTTYMPNLQRCYSMGMRTHANLTRKITLSFTVTQRGTLAKVDARGISTEVDRCVSAAMTAWKFAIPRTPAGDPTDKSIRIVLAAK